MQIAHNNNKYHILIVEDNIIAQKVGISLLERVAYQVHLAKDVREAKTLVTTKLYDLILLDIGLPDGDGKDVARAIRSNKAGINKKTPVVAVTSHAHSNEDQSSCLSAGIDQVYAKPLTHEMIIKIMHDFGL